jgi:hypothetical protein
MQTWGLLVGNAVWTETVLPNPAPDQASFPSDALHGGGGGGGTKRSCVGWDLAERNDAWAEANFAWSNYSSGPGFIPLA